MNKQRKEDVIAYVGLALIVITFIAIVIKGSMMANNEEMQQEVACIQLNKVCIYPK